MSKSARKFLTEKKTVRVSNFRQIGADLGVISWMEAEVMYVDLFNIPSEQTVAALNEVDAGKEVFATVAPDSTSDQDGHPECLEASIGQPEETKTEEVAA